jgi:hypothetical protein
MIVEKFFYSIFFLFLLFASGSAFYMSNQIFGKEKRLISQTNFYFVIGVFISYGIIYLNLRMMKEKMMSEMVIGAGKVPHLDYLFSIVWIFICIGMIIISLRYITKTCDKISGKN